MSKKEDSAARDTKQERAPGEEAAKKEEKQKTGKQSEPEQYGLPEIEPDIQVKKLEEQLLEQNEKYLRLCAEYDNFRKRSKKERETIYPDACAACVSAFLPVLDSLERAVASETDAGSKKGIELVRKQFTDSLSQIGVTEILAEGAVFDPGLHNAVMHVEDESFGENQVIEVMQKGFQLGEKVIRHAMVKVAN